jgi:RNA recognition motif-containing protein
MRMACTPVKIFVSGYPLGYDEMALAQLLSPYGRISTVKIVRDKQSRKAKGYAFIEMESLKDAEEVMTALNDREMDDKKLTINLVEVKPEPTPLRPEAITSPSRPRRPRLNK